MEIGFIGLGNMGFPMARRLIEANHDVDRLRHTRRGARARRRPGAQAASSAKDVADRAETVLASLPSPAASRQVATGPEGVIEGSRVKRYVDLSTVGSQTAVQIHDRLARTEHRRDRQPGQRRRRRSRKGRACRDGVRHRAPNSTSYEAALEATRPPVLHRRQARLGTNDEARQQHAWRPTSWSRRQKSS